MQTKFLEKNQSLEKDYSDIQLKWTTNDFVPKISDFDDQESGLKIDSLDENSNDIFTSMIPEDIVKTVILETNRLAVESKEMTWKDVRKSGGIVRSGQLRA